MYTYHNPLLLQSKACLQRMPQYFCFAVRRKPASSKGSKAMPSFVGVKPAFVKTAKSKSFIKKKLYENNVKHFSGKFFSYNLRPEKSEMRPYFSTSVIISESFSLTCFASLAFAVRRQQVPICFCSASSNASSKAKELVPAAYVQQKQASVKTTGNWKTNKAFPRTGLPYALGAVLASQGKQTISQAKSNFLAKPMLLLRKIHSKQRQQSRAEPKQLHRFTENFNFVCASQNVPEIKLFVNLLMKHGKKAKALHILEVAALLFIKSISKTDLYLKMPTVAVLAEQSQQTQIQNQTGVKKISAFAGAKDKSNTFTSSCALLAQQSTSFCVLCKASNASSCIACFAKHAKARRKQTKVANPTAVNLHRQKNVSKSFAVKKQEKKAYLCKPLHKNTPSFCLLLPNKSCSTNKEEAVAVLALGNQPSQQRLQVQLQKKRTLSFFPVCTSLDPVLKAFYLEGKTFTNSDVTPKKHTGMVFAQQKPAQAFVSSFPIIEATLKNAHRTRSFSGKDKENKQKFWYINNTFDRWHQLSDAQKNTLLFALHTAISNVKPPLEVRSKRVGGSNRQIPAAVSENRQRGYAIRWLIESANSENSVATHRKKNSNTVPLFCICLAAALKNAFYKKGTAFQKRNLWVETAQANRAFLRYRWW